MEPIRVLHVFASLDRGGAETMLMNIYRNIDRTKVQFDFVVNDNNEEYAYEKEIMDFQESFKPLTLEKKKIARYLNGFR